MYANQTVLNHIIEQIWWRHQLKLHFISELRLHCCLYPLNKSWNPRYLNVFSTYAFPRNLQKKLSPHDWSKLLSNTVFVPTHVVTTFSKDYLKVRGSRRRRGFQLFFICKDRFVREILKWSVKTINTRILLYCLNLIINLVKFDTYLTCWANSVLLPNEMTSRFY